MKYSKKVRDGAALICAIAASTPSLANAYRSTKIELGASVSHESLGLALSAWVYARDVLMERFGMSDTYQVDAEAEALIRTGWTP